MKSAVAAWKRLNPARLAWFSKISDIDMFSDLRRLTLKGGEGGMGCVSAFRSRAVTTANRDGGNGGKGGDVYVKAVVTKSPNLAFFSSDLYEGNRGGGGRPKYKDGAPGSDTHITLPLNTKVYKVKETDGEEQKFFLCELTKPNQTFLVAKGGTGGLGSSSRNFTPSEQPGTEGQLRLIEIDLSIVNDVAFLGFSCAGKSSLLSALTPAEGRISEEGPNTLSPVLGFLKFIDDSRITLLDLPPLQMKEGVFEVKDYAFSKHIVSTKLLVCMVDGSSGALKYEVSGMLTKLREFDIKTKKLCFVINKQDKLTTNTRKDLDAYFKSIGAPFFFVSAQERTGLDKLVVYMRGAVGVSN